MDNHILYGIDGMDKGVCISRNCDRYQPNYNGFLPGCRVCKKELLRIHQCPKNKKGD